MHACAGVYLSLKGQSIPTNGTGVVIFDDIGGYLGPADGLICSTTYSNIISQYWSFPNGTQISNLPSSGVFGTSNCTINKGGSLYYSGVPKERGKFECTMRFSGVSSPVKTSLYIVDMHITGPNLIWPWPGEAAIAGEDVEISVNVTTFPEDIPVPYQWLMDGKSLPANDSYSRYNGTQTDTLTIFNVQKDHQGNYSCSVANSASGINVNSIKLLVGKLKHSNVYILSKICDSTVTSL